MFETMKAKVVGAGVGLALLGSVVGGAALTGITAVGAQTPPANMPAVTQSAPAEAPESATSATEANEVLPAGAVAHADANGVDVQFDFQGIQ